MSVCNYLLYRKLLYPPVVFCAIWAADLVIVWVAGDFFYRLSSETLVILIGGAMCFSVGSAFCLIYSPKPPQSTRIPKQSLLWWMVGTMIAAMPFLYRWIVAGTADYGVEGSLFALARNFMLDTQSEGGGLQFALYSNIAAFSIPIAVLCFKEARASKTRSFVAVFISTVLNILIGGRTGLAILLLCCFTIYILKGGKLTVKAVAVLAAAMIFILGVMAVLLSKGETAHQDDFKDTLLAIKEQSELYVAGGVVGLDRVVRDPRVIPHNWQINRFPVQVAHTLGSRIEVPPIHAEFLALGPDNLIGNVYTMYFAYLDLGRTGMMVVMIFLGIVSAIIFFRALVGHPISMMLYAMIFSGFCLSISGEYFFMGLPFLLRTAAVSWCAYSAHILFTAHANNLSRIVDSLVRQTTHD